MKVYCFEPTDGYSGGCCIIIANSPMEAYGVLISANTYYADHTDVKHCTEISSLIPQEDIKEPKLILERFYIE